MLMPNLDLRQKLIAFLNDRGIISVFHYLPLHLSEMGGKFGGRQGDCPVTERVSDQLIRLPFHNTLTSNDVELVIENIRELVF
jgi:dTDP-4-amino-4,6-dideoxygalactose transaminase